MRCRLAVMTLALVASALLLAPAGAQARPHLQALIDTPPLSSAGFHDVVFPRRDSGSPVARASATANFQAYPTKEGYSIGVAVSSSYATPDPAVAQTYVDFLDSLPHAAELAKLGVYIAPANEVLSLCGGVEGTLACYDSSRELMVVPGDQTDQQQYGVSTSYVITHEYGHHIANNRAGTPFNSFRFGPKFWSSYEMVCDRSSNGLLYPGDEGQMYDRNPGEGWAETYAHMKYPDQPWTFSPLMKPDAGAFAAAAKDVSDLWHQNTVRYFSGKFGVRGTNVKHFRFELRLDGALSARLHGPARTNDNLIIKSDGGGGSSTSAAGSRDVLSYSAACRTLPLEHVTITVKRVKGAGPFTVRLSYAG